MITVDYVGLGRTIRAYRKDRRLSQEKLAELSGLSANFISCIERATRTPSVSAIVSISYALEVSPNKLLYDSLPEDMFGEMLDTPLPLRQPKIVLRNTLSNWYRADLPDESMMGERPFDQDSLSNLGFKLLGEEMDPIAPFWYFP